MEDTSKLDVRELTKLTVGAIQARSEHDRIIDDTMQSATTLLLERAKEEAILGKNRCCIQFRTPDLEFELGKSKPFIAGLRKLLKRMQFTNVMVKEVYAKDTVCIKVSWPRGKKEEVRMPVSNVNFECPICYDDKPANILMPCGHHVCTNCGKWTGKRCPMCKTMVKGEQSVFSNK